MSMLSKFLTATACGFATSVRASGHWTPVGLSNLGMLSSSDDENLSAPARPPTPKLSLPFEPGTVFSVVPVDKYDPADPYNTKSVPASLSVETGKFIAKGTYGKCYEALVDGKTRAVAKVIDLNFVRARAKHDGIANLQREFAANQFFSNEEFSHPAIMKAHGMLWDEDAQLAFLVMPYVSGVELFEFISDEATKFGQLADKTKLLNEFSLADKQTISAQLIAAVAHMHEHGWMHRDIKPENCLWDPKTKKLLLFDFGCAKQMSEGALDYQVCGTPDYVAPEIWKKVGHSLPVDVWAIGIVMFQLFSGGVMVFQHDCQEAMVEKIMIGQRTFGNPLVPWSMQVLPEDVRQPVGAFVDELLQGHPSRRPTLAAILQNKKHLLRNFFTAFHLSHPDYFTSKQLGLPPAACGTDEAKFARKVVRRSSRVMGSENSQPKKILRQHAKLHAAGGANTLQQRDQNQPPLPPVF